MSGIVFEGSLDEDSRCFLCEDHIPAGELAFALRGVIYCSMNCVQRALQEDRETGTDYTATHDQALAAVTDTIRQRPGQFILIWEPDESNDEEPQASITMFCHPSFIIHAVEVLARASVDAEPSVAPPPDD